MTNHRVRLGCLFREVYTFTGRREELMTFGVDCVKIECLMLVRVANKSDSHSDTKRCDFNF